MINENCIKQYHKYMFLIKLYVSNNNELGWTQMNLRYSDILGLSGNKMNITD